MMVSVRASWQKLQAHRLETKMQSIPVPLYGTPVLSVNRGRGRQLQAAPGGVSWSGRSAPAEERLAA